MHSFTILMSLLRDRARFLEEISKKFRLDDKVFSLLVCSSIFLAIYGAIIGSSSSWMQIIASAVKLPALYLVTSIICLPTLYLFNVFLGSACNLKQYLALLLASTSIIGVTLLGLAPIALFFRVSIDDSDFFKLMNVAVFAITGVMGINFFYKGLLFIDQHDGKSNDRTYILRGWLFLYGFVGSQMGWILRPFFGDTDREFQLFRQLEGNFYLHIWKIISEALGAG
jgi:hypothetical protein